MKKSILAFAAIALLVLNSCNQHNKAKIEEKTDGGPQAITVKLSELASSQDLICGMKIEDGHIGDTTLYQGKIYGFCSPECKAEFLKDPHSHLTQK